MGIMVHSLLWVMQGLYHQPEECEFNLKTTFRVLIARRSRTPSKPKPGCPSCVIVSQQARIKDVPILPWALPQIPRLGNFRKEGSEHGSQTTAAGRYE